MCGGVKLTLSIIKKDEKITYTYILSVRDLIFTKKDEESPILCEMK